MSHVDEGRLHEYLDRIERQADGRTGGGADGEAIRQHLAECAECRELVEEARTLRARAAELLSDAGPVLVAMPPFAEIQARARARSRQAPRRAFTMTRLTALGWAATIVLAVGIGWLARGSFGFQRRQAEAVHRVTPVTAEAPTADSLAAQAARGRGSEEEPAFSRTAPQRGRVEDAIPPATEEARELAAVPPPEPQRTEPQAPAAANVAERDQPPAAKADVPEGLAVRRQVAGVAAANEQLRLDSVAVSRELRQPADAHLEAVTVSGAAAPSADQIVRLKQEAFATETWSPVSESEARGQLGGTLHTADGLPIEGFRRGEVAGQPAVSVIQRLPGGEQLVIVQWRSPAAQDYAAQWQTVQAPAAPQAAARAARTTADTVVARDDHVLLLRAPVSADSLAVLAGRVR